MATPPSRDPLSGTDRLLVDGTNLLHALRRQPEALPAAALVGRLRAAIPATIGIELVFDGAPDRGMRGERVAAGVIVRHAGRRPADDLLIDLVAEARSAAGPAAASGLLVVTDDRALRVAVRERGARTAGASWLIGRIARPSLASPSVGNRRPPARPTPVRDEADDRPAWKPGRGATAKRGNPRRGKPPSGRMPA
jgi:hypothetical protein